MWLYILLDINEGDNTKEVLKFWMIGGGAGHFYFYIKDVVPIIPETKDVHMLKAPEFLV